MAQDSWWLVRHQSGEVKIEMGDTAFVAVGRMKWTFQECREFMAIPAIIIEKVIESEQRDAEWDGVSDGH